MKIPHKVKVFSAASFLNDFGAEMVFSLWPTFVTAFMGADLAVLGLIDGIGNMVVSLSQAAAGFLSDRARSRKIFISSGYLMGGAAKLGYSLVSSWPALIPLRVLDRAGKIRDAPRDAEVADSTDKSNRGASFGMIDSFDHAGAVSGIVAAYFLFGMLGYQQLFMVAAVPCVVAGLLVNFAMKEKPKAGENGRFRLASLDGNFRMFLFSSAMLSLGSFSYSFLIIAANLSGIEEGNAPLLYLVMTLAMMGSAYVAGRASDRFGRKPLLVFSTILLMFAALEVSRMSVLSIPLAFVAFGMHLGSLKTVQKTFASELAPADFRASALGMVQLMTGLAALPASLIVGMMWQTEGVGAAMAFSIIMAAISLALLWRVREKGVKTQPGYMAHGKLLPLQGDGGYEKGVHGERARIRGPVLRLRPQILQDTEGGVTPAPSNQSGRGAVLSLRK